MRVDELWACGVAPPLIPYSGYFSGGNWRAGASQPSRFNGRFFSLYIYIYLYNYIIITNLVVSTADFSLYIYISIYLYNYIIITSS